MIKLLTTMWLLIWLLDAAMVFIDFKPMTVLQLAVATVLLSVFVMTWIMDFCDD